MIKIANPLKIWNSSTFTHPAKSACNYSIYTLNHNLGALADDIRCFQASNFSLAPNAGTRHYYQSVSNCYGMLPYDSQTINTARVRVYNLYGPLDIYFQVEVRGGSHY